jgi:hypothetical protein
VPQERSAPAPRRARPEREANGASHRSEPRPNRGNGPAKGPAREARPARQPWEPREPRRQAPQQDNGPTPVGLGDHVPAFLRKTKRPAQA